RLIQPDIADGELRGMHADRQPARTGIDVIAGKRALAPAVELAVGIQRQRMRGNHHALAQIGQNVRRQFGMMQTHDPVLCYPNSGPASTKLRPGSPLETEVPSAMRRKPRCTVKPRALSSSPSMVQRSGTSRKTGPPTRSSA